MHIASPVYDAVFKDNRVAKAFLPAIQASIICMLDDGPLPFYRSGEL
ncbi:MAG: hypothetical protein LBL07_13065 [Tannerella sp.]|nr:hypothetical protein [Tannerella sp.]